MFDTDSKFLGILPGHLIRLSLECRYVAKEKCRSLLSDKYLLPDTSHLFKEEHFANCALGWNEEGLAFSLFVHQPFQGVALPNIEEGDALSLFIDTRDVKTTGYNTKFCHHFIALPKEVEGEHVKEATHFRGSEKRPLSDPAQIFIHSTFSRSSYQMHLFLPQEVLFGYDPTESNHIGFSYTVYRAHDIPQHFSCSSKDFKIEELPSLWSSIKLIK